MIMKKLSFLLFTLLVVACNPQNEDKYVKQYVLESYLEGDSGFGNVYLTKTLPLDQVYTFSAAAVNHADIMIYELNNFKEIVDSLAYKKSINVIGVYVPAEHKLVNPSTYYRIKIVLPRDNNHIITSETYVPGVFNAVSTSTDTVIYQNEEQLSINYTKSEYPGRQSYVVLTVVAQDTTADLTPFYEQATKEGKPTRSELQKNSSGILNESNFDVNPDNSIKIKLPWIGVAFYGDHEIWAHTIDDNVYDFIRSRDVQFGGSTVSPGEIYDIIDHVEGGTGIFGSYYKVVNSVYIKKNPLLVD